jgi:hypothetical protein
MAGSRTSSAGGPPSSQSQAAFPPEMLHPHQGLTAAAATAITNAGSTPTNTCGLLRRYSYSRMTASGGHPETAHVVPWMFAQGLTGHSVAWIARALNDAGVTCPSAADPGWNPNRSGAAWTLRTVATTLGNPRYSGRHVWNRLVQVRQRDLGRCHA